MGFELVTNAAPNLDAELAFRAVTVFDLDGPALWCVGIRLADSSAS